MVKDVKDADECDSVYASPTPLVKKKTGDVRMWLPRARQENGLIDRLHGNQYFTSLDLFSGYLSV